MSFIPYGTDPNLDKLVDSKKWEHRLKAAQQGYGLDKLTNNEQDIQLSQARLIKCEIINQGYGLDLFLYDESQTIRYFTANKLESLGYDIYTWKQKYPELCINKEINICIKFIYTMIDTDAFITLVDTALLYKTYVVDKTKSSDSNLFPILNFCIADNLNSIYLKSLLDNFDYNKTISTRNELDNFIVQFADELRKLNYIKESEIFLDYLTII